MDAVKKELRDIQSLKEYSKTIARLQKDLERSKTEAESIETELSSTGSTKTIEDVEEEIEKISTEM